MYSSLFPRDLFAEVERLQREMQQAFDTVSPSIRGFARGYPALNVGSTPTSVEVYAFAPGIDPAKHRGRASNAACSPSKASVRRWPRRRRQGHAACQRALRRAASAAC